MNIVHPQSRLTRSARAAHALGAVCAQGSQAAASLALQLLAARALGIEGLGAFAIMYGAIVFMTGFSTGFVGDSLTVLDRFELRTRAALQSWALILSIAAGVIGASVFAITGFLSVGEALLFSGAVIAFLLEDTLRRVLMAHLKFWRIIAVDLSSLAVSIGVLIITASHWPVTLGSFLLAILIGQLVAGGVAALTAPRIDRYLVRFTISALADVAHYGIWRAAQQAVRPGLLAAARVLVLAAIGLGATGELEAARIYASPTLLFVGGLSSFLFASFALAKGERLHKLVRHADLGVLLLLGATVVVGGFSIAVVPLLGRFITGHALDVWTVVAWMAYSASVAAVTPYGALAAVRGRQKSVFLIRFADSAFSLGLAALFLALGADIWAVPIALTIGSLAGGLAIRWFVLSRTSIQSEDTPDIGRARLSQSQVEVHA